jgi:hypothetical protein
VAGTYDDVDIFDASNFETALTEDECDELSSGLEPEGSVPFLKGVAELTGGSVPCAPESF